ncbi:hypothetical protein FUA23_00245 [Neolewinella aurantiaca]|uniref:Uncharacterized protein n=1 Tax=Neolewinella aurantiaca TaxID=2602767 RepID=A0A5C7FNA0_9BACT|nr:hypothetical protein [Neolewinella aurantiaca]TXF91647.1 hypothetical protein FUA23_00245 [Neolewinella aurantiaca]
MKQFLLFSLALTITLFSACGDDDDVSPLVFIGNPDGWMIETIESDYQAQADAAIAGVTDEEFAAAGRTRAGVAAEYDSLVAIVTLVEPCDQDDGLFFSVEGATQLLRRFEICENGDLNVLDVFHARAYALNASATTITFRDVTGANPVVYDVDELSENNLSFSGTRMVSDTIVGDFSYDIQYNLIAN